MVYSPLYPFDFRFGELFHTPLCLNAPDGTLSYRDNGYFVKIAGSAERRPLQWKGSNLTSTLEGRVSIVLFPDGAWATSCIDRLVYWLYPFSSRIHTWGLDADGERVVSGELDKERSWDFLLSRRQFGVEYLTRLLLIAAEDPGRNTTSLLLSEISERLLLSSPELAYTALSYELIKKDDIRYKAALASIEQFVHIVPSWADDYVNSISFHTRTDPLLAFLEASARNQEYYLIKRRENRIALDFQKGAPWYLTSGPRAGVVTAYESPVEQINYLFKTTPELSFQIQININSNIPLEIVVPAPRHRWHPRIIPGMAVISMLVRDYILRPHHRYDLVNLYAIDPNEDLVGYCQTADCPVPLPHCVAFERPNHDSFLTLLPDPYFIQSFGYHDIRGSAACYIPWNERVPKAFWRGSTTGLVDDHDLLTADNFIMLSRIQLCNFARGNLALMDVGITDIVQCDSAETEALIRTYSQQNNLIKEYVPLLKMARFKFLIDIDGNANSWGFFSKLLLGSCVLKVDSKWQQWYYDDLVPWTHYVPIRGDLSDVVDKVQWCLDHDSETQAIAQNGVALARERTFDRECAQASRRLLESFKEWSRVSHTDIQRKC